MDFIKYEGEKKIQRLNGDNPKEAPEPKYAHYESSKIVLIKVLKRV